MLPMPQSPAGYSNSFLHLFVFLCLVSGHRELFSAMTAIYELVQRNYSPHKIALSLKNHKQFLMFCHNEKLYLTESQMQF